MKNQGAIKHKLKQVKHRLLQKAIRKSLSKRPSNCKYSGQVKGSANDPLFYVCLQDADRPKEWDGVICDPSVPNNCPFFTPHRSEEEIKEAFNKEFDDLINEGDIGKIASKYPDVAALLWVLSDETGGDEDDRDT